MKKDKPLTKESLIQTKKILSQIRDENGKVLSFSDVYERIKKNVEEDIGRSLK